MMTVPLSAVSETDDAGASISPSVGDMVDLGKAQAKVVSIDGDTASLEVESVNGQKCMGADAEDAEDGADEAPEGIEDAVALAGDKAMAAKLFAKASRSDTRKGL